MTDPRGTMTSISVQSGHLPGQLGFSHLPVARGAGWLPQSSGDFAKEDLDALTSGFRPVCCPEAQCRLDLGSGGTVCTWKVTEL